jgi:hypothetical protein
VVQHQQDVRVMPVSRLKMAEMKISGQDIFNSKILVSCGLAHIGENNLVSAFDSHLL